MPTARTYIWSGEVSGDWNTLGNWRVQEQTPSVLPGRDPANYADSVVFDFSWGLNENYGAEGYEVLNPCSTGPTVGNAASLAWVGNNPEYCNLFAQACPVMFANVTAGGLDAWDGQMLGGRVTGSASFQTAYIGESWMGGGQVDGDVYIGTGAQVVGGTILGKLTGQTWADCGPFTCGEFDLTLEYGCQFYGVTATKGRLDGDAFHVGECTVGEFEMHGSGVLVGMITGTLNMYGGSIEAYGATVLNLFGTHDAYYGIQCPVCNVFGGLAVDLLASAGTAFYLMNRAAYIDGGAVIYGSKFPASGSKVIGA